MRTNPPKPREYCPPTSERIIMDVFSVLCSSPGAGENEEIGFEDWGIDDIINKF